MKNDFDYSTVPYTFMHCINTACVQANDCVRHKLMQHITPDRTSISIVNPAGLPDNGKECPHFFADKKTRFALGITNLLSNLPHNKAVAIGRDIQSHFERNTYYRIRNNERLIKPSEQNYIRQLFKRRGITEEPVFDTYIEQYEW